MRKELLDIIQCPRCGGDAFSLSVGKVSESEIVEGTIRCLSCGLRMAIRRGTLDLLWEPSEDVRREIDAVRIIDGRGQKAIADRGIEATVEHYRLLPYGDGSPIFSAPGLFSRVTAMAPDVERMVSLMRLRPGELVLDIGADTCWASGFLARKGARVVAIDILREHLEGGDTFFVGPVYFDRILCDFEKSCLKPETMDAAVCIATLHHFKNLSRALRAIYRVLKPGGRFMAMDESFAEAHPCELKTEERTLGIKENVYPLHEYLDAARAAGFECRSYILLSTVADFCRKRIRLHDRSPLKLLAYRLGPVACSLLSAPFLSRLSFPVFSFLFRLSAKRVRRGTPEIMTAFKFGFIAHKPAYG